MKGKDYFLVFLTFVTGMFAGMYVYVTSFGPEYVAESVKPTSEITFELAGETYGGCSRAMEDCARFTLKENRSYEYTPGHLRGETKPASITGVMPKDEYNKLVSEVKTTNLTSLQQPGGRCLSAADGLDYRYRLIYQGQEFTFDTCNTKFGVSPLGASLTELWTAVATSTSWVDSVSDFNLGNYLGEELNKRLHTE